MAPAVVVFADITDSRDDDWEDKDEWTFGDYWRAVIDWFARFFHGVNQETIEHPYYIAIALFVIVAWPHILMLPVWFTKDAARRVDDHTRELAARLVGPPRRRRRDAWVARYRSLMSTTIEPPPSPRPPLFGGTPLTEGDFRIEEERHLSIGMKVLRWSALAWAIFILCREWYHVLERID